MTYDPINPRPPGERLTDDPLRDGYSGSSSFGSPGQILVVLALVIAAVVGLGIFFGGDGSNVQTSESQPTVQTPAVQAPAVEPQAQPEQSSQAPAPAAPAEGTSTN